MKDHFKYLVHTLIGGQALETARREGTTRLHRALRQSQLARACAATDHAARERRFIVDNTSNTTNKTNTNSTDTTNSNTNTDTSNTTATNATTTRAQTDATTNTTAATDATTAATHTEATTAFEATTNRATTLADETTYRRTEVHPHAHPSTSIAIRLGRSPSQPESCARVGRPTPAAATTTIVEVAATTTTTATAFQTTNASQRPSTFTPRAA